MNLLVLTIKLLNYSSGVCLKVLKNNMNHLVLTADHHDHM